MNEKTKISLKIVFILFYYLYFTTFYKVDAINTFLTIVVRTLVNTGSFGYYNLSNYICNC